MIFCMFRALVYVVPTDSGRQNRFLSRFPGRLKGFAGRRVCADSPHAPPAALRLLDRSIFGKFTKGPYVCPKIRYFRKTSPSVALIGKDSKNERMAIASRTFIF